MSRIKLKLRLHSLRTTVIITMRCEQVKIVNAWLRLRLLVETHWKLAEQRTQRERRARYQAQKITID